MSNVVQLDTNKPQSEITPFKAAFDFTRHINSQGRLFLSETSSSGKTQVYDHALKQQLSIEAISREYSRWYISQKYSTYIKFNDVKDIIYSQLQTVVREEFDPSTTNEIIIKDGYHCMINKYRKFTPSNPPATALTLWHEFTERLFPVEVERDTVLNWLAHIIQHPEIRPSWSLLLSSDTGTGKGYLFHNILTPILANQTALCDSYESFMGKFSSALNGTLLVLLDDPKSNSDSTMTRLKSKLTEPNQTVDEKYKAPRIQPVYSRVILASNEKRPLKLDENERRWFVPTYLKHKVDREETTGFISELDEWVNNNGLEAIYNFLLQRNLNNFDPYSCPRTSLLKEMTQQSESCLKGYCREFIINRSMFKLPILKEWLADTHKTSGSDDVLSKYLSELNFIKRSMWNPDKGNRSTWWVISTIGTNKQAQALMEDEKKAAHPFC